MPFIPNSFSNWAGVLVSPSWENAEAMWWFEWTIPNFPPLILSGFSSLPQPRPRSCFLRQSEYFAFQSNKPRTQAGCCQNKHCSLISAGAKNESCGLVRGRKRGRHCEHNRPILGCSVSIGAGTVKCANQGGAWIWRGWHQNRVKIFTFSPVTR